MDLAKSWFSLMRKVGNHKIVDMECGRYVFSLVHPLVCMHCVVGEVAGAVESDQYHKIISSLFFSAAV